MVSGPSLQLIVGLVALTLAFGFGWRVNGWRMGEQLADLEAQHHRLVAESSESLRLAVEAAGVTTKARQERTNAIADATEARLEAARARGRVITNEIVRYASNPLSARCQLDADFVSIHDTAARSPAGGGVSTGASTGSEPDADTRTVAAADALLVITDNYASCHATRERLIGLQEWARGITE